MAHPAQRSGCRGHSKKRINRYNPSQPDYNAVHAPWLHSIATMLATTTGLKGKIRLVK